MAEDNIQRKFIGISPAGVAFFKALNADINDPKLMTQEFLIRLDHEITVIHDMGYPTSELTEALDELWQHLLDKRFAAPLPQERLEKLQKELQ